MKVKSFITGLIVGSILTTTVSVTAQNQKVEAWLTDHVKINIDGNDRTLPSDVHIVNYENKVYVPVRYLVEQMDGKVDYDAGTARVIIKKPEAVIIKEIVKEEPKVEEPEVEEPKEEVPEVKPVEVTEAIKSFQRAPMKLKIQNVTINVFGMERDSEETVINFDLNNDDNGTIFLDYPNAYIEVDGIKYPGLYSGNVKWDSSVEAYKVMDDTKLYFEPVPEDVKRMEIVIPIEMDRYDTSSGYVTETKTFSFPIEFTE